MAASLAGAACWYATRGHLVLPLKPGSKVPATAHGLHDATTDLDLIRRWWLSNPDHNIGLTTGHQFDVIDIDGAEGIRSIADIEDAGHLPIIIGRACTPRGWHLYTHPTGDGNATALRPGIDYRGLGGYVVAPPSTVDGSTYRWAQPLGQDS